MFEIAKIPVADAYFHSNDATDTYSLPNKILIISLGKKKQLITIVAAIKPIYATYFNKIGNVSFPYFLS